MKEQTPGNSEEVLPGSSRPRAVSLNVTSESAASEVLEVLHAAYREEARLLGLDEFPPLRRKVASIQEAPTAFVGLRVEERLVAVAEIEALASGGFGISSFVVHPGFFRRGLGGRLLQFLLARYPEHPLEVSTAAENLPAIRLYEKHGFRITKTWQQARGISMVTLECSR